MLVHSPVVGPSTWRWVVKALESRGHRADLPDLRNAARTGDPHAFIRAACSYLARDTDVIAGHSGAGFFVPLIGASVEVRARLVFVDAGVPPCDGEAAA